MVWTIFECNEDYVAAAIEGPSDPLTICSEYMGHDQVGPPLHILLRQLVEDSVRRKMNLLIGADANAHYLQ